MLLLLSAKKRAANMRRRRAAGRAEALLGTLMSILTQDVVASARAVMSFMTPKAASVSSTTKDGL